jgi:hypothetical protein
MSDAGKSHRETFGELIERAAEELDRLAAPVYGDPPRYSGPELAIDESHRLCPLCGQPLDEHPLSFDILDRSRYISCPVTNREQLSY